MGARTGWLLDLRGGLVPYAEAWARQRELLGARQAGAVPDILLLLEHAPVVTLGRSAKIEHLLISPEILRGRGIDLFEVERGGDVTYHGPGQLVGYPIVDLRALDEDVVRYMRLLEESLIRTLAVFGIAAGRERGYPGVWVGGAKVAAIGVAVKRRVTMHGFALNVTTDLRAFELINPCGLGRPVTSMSALLGRPVDMDRVRAAYAEQFAQVFGIGLARVERTLVDAAMAAARARESSPSAPEAAART
jgi:lipoate-protein ligase B